MLISPAAWLAAGALVIAVPGTTLTQPAPSPRAPRPEAATVSALLSYPLFYHGQQVLLRAEVSQGEDFAWIMQEDQKVLMNGERADPDAGMLEMRGTFFDVGRLDPEDPRMDTYQLSAVSQATVGRDRPGVGEVLIVHVTSIEPAPSPPGPSVRAVALEPMRYVDQRVTVTGRFRGRNLYGDLPNAPGQGRWDFVVQSAGAAIWVTDLQPKGKDFTLNPGARVDTSRWLDVTGVVKHARGLTWIQATQVALAKTPAEATIVETRPEPPPQPPPDVVFSAPTEDETDVDPRTTVRIQFSREMNPKSFPGKVRVGYLGDPSTPSPEVPSTSEYRPGARVLEIRFSAPLERFRTVRVELLEGVTAIDGVPLGPWTLSFSLGE